MAIYCEKCGAALNPETGKCPNCSQEKKNSNTIAIYIVIALIGLLAIGLLIYLFIGPSAASHSNDAEAPRKTSSQVDTSSVTRHTLTTVITSSVAAETTTPDIGNAGSNNTVGTNGRAYDTNVGILFPDSSTRMLTDAEVQGLTSEQVQQAINDISARNGYLFKKDNIRIFFEQYSWYNGTISDMNTIDNAFNNVEKENIKLLTKYR